MRRLLPAALMAACLAAPHAAIARGVSNSKPPHRHTPATSRHRASRVNNKKATQRKAKALFFSTAAVGGPGIAQATVAASAVSYYASPTGNATLTKSSSSKPMSLDTALASAPAGATIHLAPGTYPAVRDTSRRSGYVTISGAGDATVPTIQGASLWGSQYLRFASVRFTPNAPSRGSVAGYAVYVNHSPTSTSVAAEHIQILNSEIDCGTTTTAAQTTGLMVRGGAQDVTLSGDYVHNCNIGFTSASQDRVSTQISLSHNVFTHFSGDAIDLGGLSNVTIDHNVVEDISDPAGVWHDDGIQFFGNVAHVQITNNILANSRDQLIFIQDAIKSLATGSSVNQDILVARNLIYGAGAFAIQSQGGVDVRFIDNTMWDNHYGSLLIRKSPFTGLASPGAVVLGNIIQGYGLDQATPTAEDYNLITKSASTYTYGRHDLLNANPSFVNPGVGDFRLAADSVATTAGNGSVTSAFLPQTVATADMDGLTPMPDGLGAFAPADPATAYGAPAPWAD